MNICINGVTRPMTPEEEFAYLHPTPTAEEALTRYTNSITGANDPDLLSAAETMITKLARED